MLNNLIGIEMNFTGRALEESVEAKLETVNKL
jgi:hypothetical protein